MPVTIAANITSTPQKHTIPTESKVAEFDTKGPNTPVATEENKHFNELSVAVSEVWIALKETANALTDTVSGIIELASGIAVAVKGSINTLGGAFKSLRGIAKLGIAGAKLTKAALDVTIDVGKVVGKQATALYSIHAQ